MTDTPTSPESPLVPRWLARVGAWSWRLLPAAAVLGVLLWLVVELRLVVVAVFLGLVLTAVLRPLTKRYQRFAHPAVAAVLALLTGVVAVLAVLALAVFGIAGEWPRVIERVGAGVRDLLDLARSGGLPVTVTDADLERWVQAVTDWLRANGTTLAGAAATRVGTLLVALMVVALGVFSAVCFLIGGDRMWSWFVGQLPRDARGAWRTAGDVAWRAFGGYTRGAVLTAVCVGGLAYLVLLGLGVPLAVPLAVLVLVGAFIPLIGAPAAMIVAMLVALAANGPGNAVLVGIGIALVGQVEGHLLHPLIMGKHVRLHPFVVGVGVSAGTVLGGLVGAIVAIPVLGVGWAVFSALRTPPEPDDPQPVDGAVVGSAPGVGTRTDGDRAGTASPTTG